MNFSTASADGPERDHEEPRVAVERDELAGGDLPGGREVRADPGDEDDEEPGQQHLRGVEGRLRRRHPDAGDADALGALPVAVEEDLLAADAAQDAETGCSVGAERRQQADLLALLPLPALQRLDHEAEREHEQRHAEQDEEAERRSRSRAGSPRRRGTTTIAAGEPREDLEGSTGPQGVVR